MQLGPEFQYEDGVAQLEHLQYELVPKIQLCLRVVFCSRGRGWRHGKTPQRPTTTIGPYSVIKVLLTQLGVPILAFLQSGRSTCSNFLKEPTAQLSPSTGQH